MAAPGARSQSPDDVATAASESSDIAALLERLRTIPEVRSDVVERIAQRLERGEYLTRDAAEQTAAALLGSRTN